MTSLKWCATRIGTVAVACGAILIAVLATPGTPSRVLAQSSRAAGVAQTRPGVGLPAQPAAAAAIGRCGLQTLRGLYVFAASGYNIVDGVPQPKAIVEEIRFNGDGTLTVPAVTVSVNGAINRPPAGGVGTYAVATDCTGMLTFIPGPSFDLFLEPHGDDGWMIQTNPGTVFQGTVKRISR